MAKGSWAWKFGRGLGSTQHYVAMGPAVVVYAGASLAYKTKVAAADINAGRKERLAEFERQQQAEFRQKAAEARVKADMNAAGEHGTIVQVVPV